MINNHIRSNFDMLRAYEEQLWRLGALAERYFAEDPNTSLLKLRQFSELLAQSLAARTGLYTQPEESQYELIRRLLGEGVLPGLSTGLSQPSWEEFLPQLGDTDLSGKIIAIYGLGDQKKYPDVFVDAIGLIHDAMQARGATLTGYWPTSGYEFTASQAVDRDHFLGLALDQINQPLLTEERLERWLNQISPMLT